MSLVKAENAIYSLCIVGFIWQTYSGIIDQYFSKATTSTVTDLSLNSLDKLPIVLDIVVSRGFNFSALKMKGYKDPHEYFFGRSAYNDSVFGWAGHKNSTDSLEDVNGKLLTQSE